MNQKRNSIVLLVDLSMLVNLKEKKEREGIQDDFTIGKVVCKMKTLSIYMQANVGLASYM